ncbi:ZIP family metal transporter [Thiohalobacter sp. COW1]|uniref:Zinc/iron permease n=1 Tax=Thiohalobacter thiocyanaticus TaxID=585455 RepID=A0A1Z4VQW5_9GAMM|nr:MULTISPECIES: ZIP family metal transporter [Thiohalobacter]BAZ94040.1 zinc/iron permease [Thiohalobacter thiocyanaticus]BCO30894.1 ZIP family metal transporter [Thiohalobacter sp. COW1]
MENSFWTALIASSLAALVTSLGIYTIRRFTAWGHRNTTYFMCFAAGVLVSASFLHIIPKSFSMNPQAPFWLLAGFLGLHLFNRFVTAFVCERDPERKDYAIGLIPMLGIGLHSLIDGFIYSITFTVSILTGYLATLGMVLHEFPEGIITYLLLVRGGIAERRAVLLAFLAAAATTPLGMLVSYPFISAIDRDMLGALLSLSAGALVYVGATHLLPRAEQEHRRYSLVALAGGVFVAMIIVASKA